MINPPTGIQCQIKQSKIRKMILYIRIQEFDLLLGWLLCRGSRSSREFGSKGFSLGYQDIAKEDMGTVGVEEAD
jgi:hypothetical protein